MKLTDREYSVLRDLNEVSQPNGEFCVPSPPQRRVEMSKPEDIPQDVWDKADEAASGFFGTGLTRIIARAIMAAKAEEQEACAQAIATANLRVAGIETPLMRGDNLAITLCTHFDDGEPSEDDTGWSPAAIAGYEQVIDAIRDHYTSAIRNRATP